MESGNGSYPWYAVQVRPRFEKQVASTLVSKDIEGFLPLYRCRNRWSDRIKEVELPLFPGYLFCRLDITKRMPVLVTPGVLRFVGIGRTPMPVDESEIWSLLAIVSAGLQAEPHPYISVGEKVRIDRGTLSGVEGIVQATKKPARLIVSVSLLQRSVSVEIDESWVSPLKLRKTNDELRMTNDELRNANDELRMTNDELRMAQHRKSITSYSKPVKTRPSSLVS
jgi:transcription antitermination factor NusG